MYNLRILFSPLYDYKKKYKRKFKFCWLLYFWLKPLMSSQYLTNMCWINHLKLASALRKLSSDIEIWTVFGAFVFSIGLPSLACILFLFFLPHLFLLSFHFCLNILSMGYSMNCTLFIWFWHQWKLVFEDVIQISNLLSDVVNHTHPPSSVLHSPLIRSLAQVLPESDLIFPFPPMLTLSASLSKSLCFACFFHLPPHSSQFLTFLYHDSQLFLCSKSLLNSIVKIFQIFVYGLKWFPYLQGYPFFL